MENSFVLCSEVIVHDAISDGVDGAAEEPQASGRDENLRCRKKQDLMKDTWCDC